MIYLGFDTSNYTTSVAAVSDEIKISKRRILEVKQGERGLRQSDAVFQHIKNLPDLFLELSNEINMNEVGAIGVSVTPRSVKDSYMPVFLAGQGYAKVCAAALGVPTYSYSHQDGHIMAGIYSSTQMTLLNKPFISVHLSGGTLEILVCEYNGKNFNCEIIGGTLDISAGQLIDRVGVALSMKFPCGKEMEKVADSCDNLIKLPVNVDKSYINFSGIETKTLSLISDYQPNEICYSVFVSIAKALEKALNYCILKYSIKDVLIVGGVAANKIIKTHLQNNVDAQVVFADIEYSTDNALGTAILAYLENKNSK